MCADLSHQCRGGSCPPKLALIASLIPKAIRDSAASSLSFNHSLHHWCNLSLADEETFNWVSTVWEQMTTPSSSHSDCLALLCFGVWAEPLCSPSYVIVNSGVVSVCVCVCVCVECPSVCPRVSPGIHRFRVNLWLIVPLWPLQLISPLKPDLKVNLRDSQKGQCTAFMYIQQNFN